VEHADHVSLLREGVPPGGTWADLGAGRGAFTLALAELVGPEAKIYAVDRDAAALRDLEQSLHRRFRQEGPTGHIQKADFTQELALPALDGIVMANSLHFYRDKEGLLRRLASYLAPGGRFILVEYNADRGNPWVPYPLSYTSWKRLAPRAGLESTRLLETRPSRFLHQIYSALSIRP